MKQRAPFQTALTADSLLNTSLEGLIVDSFMT